MVFSFLYKLLINTGRIYIGAVINNSNLLSQTILTNILCGCKTLVRIGEAYAEVVIILNTFYCRSGRSDLEHIVFFGLVGTAIHAPLVVEPSMI